MFKNKHCLPSGACRQTQAVAGISSASLLLVSFGPSNSSCYHQRRYQRTPDGSIPDSSLYKYSSLGQACPFLGLTFICTVRARPRSVTLNSFFSFQQQNLCFSPVFQGCIIGYETDRMELPQLLRIWGSVLRLPLPSPRAPLPDSTEHSVVLAHLPATSSSPSPNSVDGWKRGRVATRSASHGSLPTANPY